MIIFVHLFALAATKAVKDNTLTWLTFSLTVHHWAVVVAQLVERSLPIQRFAVRIPSHCLIGHITFMSGCITFKSGRITFMSGCITFKSGRITFMSVCITYMPGHITCITCTSS